LGFSIARLGAIENSFIEQKFRLWDYIFIGVGVGVAIGIGIGFCGGCLNQHFSIFFKNSIPIPIATPTPIFGKDWRLCMGVITYE